MLSFEDPMSLFVDRIVSGKVAGIASIENLKALRNINCRIHVARKRAYKTDLAMAVMKGSALKKKFDEQ